MLTYRGMENIKCPTCGQPLSMLDLSISKDTLICSNVDCLAFCNPVHLLESVFDGLKVSLEDQLKNIDYLPSVIPN